jgi:hypothetical protein
VAGGAVEVVVASQVDEAVDRVGSDIGAQHNVERAVVGLDQRPVALAVLQAHRRAIGELALLSGAAVGRRTAIGQRGIRGGQGGGGFVGRRALVVAAGGKDEESGNCNSEVADASRHGP